MRLNSASAGTAALAICALATPALAVGLSPLRKEGAVAGANKAYYLTVINPYADRREFVAYQDGLDQNAKPPQLTIHPARLAIAPRGQRRIMVIVRELAPGETRETRVCAELAKQQGMFHARVCSTLVSRRLPLRG